MRKEGKYCIMLNTLIREGLLNEPIIDSEGKKLSLSTYFYLDYDEEKHDLYESISTLTCTKLVYEDE
jgi:hypothetical protein